MSASTRVANVMGERGQMLARKRLLISGLVDERSIAFAVARRAQLEGAEILLTALHRDRPGAELAAAKLPVRAEVHDLDARSGDEHDELAERIAAQWGGLDGALHAIAFAPRDALSGDFLAARPEGISLALQTSAVSLAHMARLLRRLAPSSGASLVGLDFDAARAWPVYNWMGVCKAALEATMRYLARDLGPELIRVNLVAAGPLRTRAAGGIGDFERLLSAWEQGSPLPWDPDDARPVADPVIFLLSDLARAISGQVIHVDGGYSAMAAPLVKPGSLVAESQEVEAAR